MEQAKTLKELVAQETSAAVENASNDLTETFKHIDGMLRKREIHIQQALLQMLGATVEVRNMELKNALSEYQMRQQAKRAAEEAQKTAELERTQQVIAEANKPKLAVVPGLGGGVQQ